MVDTPRPVRGNLALNSLVQAVLTVLRDRRKAEREQPCGLVLAKLGDPDRAPSQPILDHSQWEVALLEVDDLGRPAMTLRQGNELCIRGDDRKLIGPSPVPDLLVACLLQSNFAHMRQSGKKQVQPVHQTR